ncbi:regulator of microtubule dynamics protein 1-like [Actinia tenebrosa]|uniref:Regulator of microtubule dynamics protein 1 n=1 Tax=Actinia tenebrosa TaxID=6105 RepID=A0A6P8I9I8_ACTTE|nr:regulator of microtubule dynamics protein 1-like [Actinia tenebrosa]XP_031561315.1 regulator of microtubule dynamics protein 1-like [Actinia tenebrosa]
MFPAPPLVAFSLFGATSKVESKKEVSDEELAIIESDRLFDTNEINDLYKLLSKYRESKNADILWKLARAARNKAELCKNYDDKKAFTFEALDFAKRSVELDDSNFACHKWYGITLSNAGDFEGTKVKIQNAYKIRDEFQRAIELNSTDPTCRYLLGLWCFTFADMPWYQHKIAAAIFSTPPSSTYREALDHFEMAESLQADFFSKNHLMIGKTNLRLKKKEEAKIWLSKAANCICKTVDDEQAKAEAEELLKTI